MSDMQIIDVRAKIELFPSHVSGKTRGYLSGIRPNHFFEQESSSIPGVIEFIGQGSLELGRSCTAFVRFLRPVDWRPIEAGQEWRINEGSKQVGQGVVLEVLRTLSDQPPFPPLSSASG